MKIRDISHHDYDNGTPNLSSYDGVIIKATEGVGYVDPKLGANVNLAISSGKPFGLYHFLSFKSDITAQLSAFRDQLTRYNGYTLRPVLDVEKNSTYNSKVPEDINERIAAFKASFVNIVLYANPDMLTRLDVSKHGVTDLWQAEYNPQPRDITGYNRIGWQYQENPDESTFTDALYISGKAPSATVQPVDNGSRPAPAFPLPSGSYFGPKTGPANSVSGYYSHREDLRKWQQRMKDRGWAITADGLYGNETATTAKKFQAEKGYAVDGLIGPQTWAGAWTEPIT